MPAVMALEEDDKELGQEEDTIFMQCMESGPCGHVVRAESMDLQNDPRFFQSNVIDKRLTAFSGLGIISGIMVSTTMSELYSMDKDISLLAAPVDATVEILAFTLVSGVLYGNMVATYVAVAQTYHTYRLMTAGPTGFEMASTYYLHKHILFWRHFAIKFMLTSMPVFLFSTGLRMFYKWDRAALPKFVQDNGQDPTPVPAEANVRGMSIIAVIVCIVYTSAAVSVIHIHRKHMRVFRERYNMVRQRELPLVNHVHRLSQRASSHHLDV